MPILCSCRIISTGDIRRHASTCLRDVGALCAKRLQQNLVAEKGPPLCSGCAPSIKDEVRSLVSSTEMEADLAP